MNPPTSSMLDPSYIWAQLSHTTGMTLDESILSGDQSLASGLASAVSSGVLTPLEEYDINHAPLFPEEEVTAALQQLLDQRNMAEAQAQQEGQQPLLDATQEDLKKQLALLDPSNPIFKRRRSRASELSIDELRAKNERRLLHNRHSAKQSRERKKAFIGALEMQVNELQQIKNELESTIAQLMYENQRLRSEDPQASNQVAVPDLSAVRASLAAVPQFGLSAQAPPPHQPPQPLPPSVASVLAQQQQSLGVAAGGMSPLTPSGLSALTNHMFPTGL